MVRSRTQKILDNLWHKEALDKPKIYFRCMTNCLFNSSSFAFALNFTSRKCFLIHEAKEEAQILSGKYAIGVFVKESGTEDEWRVVVCVMSAT